MKVCIYKGEIVMSDLSRYWYTDLRDMVTLKDLLKGSRELYPNNAAFWVKKVKGGEYLPITYTLLDRDVDAIGTKLNELGLSEKPVAIMGQGCYEWIVTYLAVMNGGSIAVPIDKELSGPEIGNLLNASECSTIFCTKEESKKLAGLDMIKRLVIMEFYGDRVELTEPAVSGIKDRNKYTAILPEAETLFWRDLLMEGEALLDAGNRSFVDYEIDPDRLAAILFTSGTTGKPKGVMLCHRNITVNIMDVCRIAHVFETDKTLSILPIHHTYECTLGMLLVLYRGASTAFCEGFKYISQNMKEAGNTVLIVVPRVLELVYGKVMRGIKKQGKEKTFERAMKINRTLRKMNINISRKLFKSILDELGGQLRFIVTGAAALNPNIFRFFEDIGVIVLQGYGMTECTPLLTGTPMSAMRERYRKAGSCGVTVETGEIRIEDKDADGIGEIVFRGPNVMMGYYHMPDETAEVLTEDGWLRTGDMGFLDPEGWIYLTGRKKNVIVTGTGENVYPEEIEDFINFSPYIEEAMVFPFRHDGIEEVGVQILPEMDFIKEQLGHEPDDEELDKLMKNVIKDLNQELAVYKRMTKVFVRKEDFVRTTTRKIKRQDNMM